MLAGEKFALCGLSATDDVAYTGRRRSLRVVKRRDANRQPPDSCSIQVLSHLFACVVFSGDCWSPLDAECSVNSVPFCWRTDRRTVNNAAVYTANGAGSRRLTFRQPRETKTDQSECKSHSLQNANFIARATLCIVRYYVCVAIMSSTSLHRTEWAADFHKLFSPPITRIWSTTIDLGNAAFT